MKNNLGKLLLFAFSILFLNAGDFNYAVKVDKQNPYVKEAVLLTLDINQTNPNIVMLFNLTLVKSDDYNFQRLDIKETDSYHNAKIQYLYLIYPLKAGKIDIHFDLLQKVTTDESVAYSFSGDRDNVKTLVTVDTPVRLKPLTLNVKPLPPKTLLVGDFTLTQHIPKHKAKAYEPLPFQVTIKGKGYPPLLDTLIPKDGNFTRFTEQAIVKSIASKEGTHNHIVYPMALSHSESFTLETIRIHAFDPQTEKSYTLKIPAQHFDISQVETENLVDKIDSPQAWEEDWSWVKTLLGYLVVFAAGYLTALSLKWQKKASREKRHPLRDKIENAKGEKALLQLLISIESKQFDKSIEMLERSIYGEKKINFKKIKQEILEKLQ